MKAKWKNCKKYEDTKLKKNYLIQRYLKKKGSVTIFIV